LTECLRIRLPCVEPAQSNAEIIKQATSDERAESSGLEQAQEATSGWQITE
jgi:hypothetical protein